MRHTQQAAQADSVRATAAWPPGCGEDGCLHHYAERPGQDGNACTCSAFFSTRSWCVIKVNPDCTAHLIRTESEDQAMITDEDVAAIQRWANDHSDHVRAAVQLLIEHDHWLWDEGFAKRCVGRAGDGIVYVNFHAAAAYWREEPPCSEGQAAILLAAADLGSGRWRIPVMDCRNRERLLRAVATATGVTLPAGEGQLS